MEDDVVAQSALTPTVIVTLLVLPLLAYLALNLLGTWFYIRLVREGRLDILATTNKHLARFTTASVIVGWTACPLFNLVPVWIYYYKAV